MSTSDIITRVIGTGNVAYNGENVQATSSNMYSPAGVAVDSSNGDIYVAAFDGSRIQVLTRSSGLVSTIAGTGTSTTSGDGGSSTQASVNQPDALFLTTTGDLYFGERAGNRVRKLYFPSPSMEPSVVPTVGPSVLPSRVPSVSPIVSPTIGPSTLPTTMTPSTLPTASPSLSPTALPSVSPSTSAPSNVRGTYNLIATVVGTGSSSSSGTGGFATAASINGPRGIWMDSVGFLYFGEANSNCVRGFSTSTNIVVNILGSCGATGANTGDGNAATSALVNYPIGVFGNTAGVVYVADYYSNRVRYILSGIVRTFAGSGNGVNSGDGGFATAAGVFYPVYVAVDRSSNVYIISNYDRIRLVDTVGIITLYAG